MSPSQQLGSLGTSVQKQKHSVSDSLKNKEMKTMRTSKKAKRDDSKISVLKVGPCGSRRTFRHSKSWDRSYLTVEESLSFLGPLFLRLAEIRREQSQRVSVKLSIDEYGRTVSLWNGRHEFWGSHLTREPKEAKVDSSERCLLAGRTDERSGYPPEP
jgi:hypothetical protein